LFLTTPEIVATTASWLIVPEATSNSNSWLGPPETVSPTSTIAAVEVQSRTYGLLAQVVALGVTVTPEAAGGAAKSGVVVFCPGADASAISIFGGICGVCEIGGQPEKIQANVRIKITTLSPMTRILLRLIVMMITAAFLEVDDVDLADHR
jgi:hypothetical protein